MRFLGMGDKSERNSVRKPSSYIIQEGDRSRKNKQKKTVGKISEPSMTVEKLLQSACQNACGSMMFFAIFNMSEVT